MQDKDGKQLWCECRDVLGQCQEWHDKNYQMPKPEIGDMPCGMREFPPYFAKDVPALHNETERKEDKGE